MICGVKKSGNLKIWGVVSKLLEKYSISEKLPSRLVMPVSGNPIPYLPYSKCRPDTACRDSASTQTIRVVNEDRG